MIVNFKISVPDEESAKRAGILFFDALDEEGIDYRVVTEEEPDMQLTRLPGFRSSDPDTSRKGAFDQYPRQKTHLHRALLCVAAAGSYGATYEDVEDNTKINGVWKRLSELMAGGWITVKGERKIESTNSMGAVYVLTEKGQRYVEIKDPAYV
jgi:hypothetical protein